MIKVNITKTERGWMVVPGSHGAWVISTTDKVLATDPATGYSVLFYVTNVPPDEYVCDHCSLQTSKRPHLVGICDLTRGCSNNRMCYKTSEDLLEGL